VLGAAGIALIMMPAAAAVSRWLPRSRGTAMGVISAGSSLSAFLFYPLNAWLIAALGWRQAFAAYGAIVAVGVVGFALFGYPRGAARAATGQDEPRPVAGRPADWTLAAALRSPRFWAVFVMWGLGVIGYQVMQTHQVAHARGQGIDPATVAWVLGLGGLFTAAGNLVGGALSERWGREAVFALGSVIGIAGIAVFATLDGPGDVGTLLAYAAAGFGFGMRIALLTAIPADLFHGRHFGAILGFANGGGGLGGLIGPFLGGWLFDVTRDYRAAFAVAALAIAGSAVAAWLAGPRHARAAARS
jgi:MFS family permease